MNETSGTTFADSSIYGNTATVSGGVTLGTVGKLNSAATFDGTSGYASVPDIAAYGVTTNFSITHWVKAPSNTGMSIRFGPSASCGFSVFPTNTGVDLTTSNGSYNHNTVSTAILSDGAWHFVAVTFSNGTAVFYIDNSIIGTLTSVAVPSAVAAGTCSRYITSQGGSKFTGSLDDIAIWSATLTSAQIQTIYTRQSAKYSGQLTSRVMDAFSSQSWTSLSSITTLPFYKELPGSVGSESSTNYSSIGGSLMSGIVGLWHLNETSGTTGANSVIDSSGSGNHAAPNNISFGVPGQFGSAAGFNSGSNQKIVTANSLSVSLNSFTAQAWFKTTASGDMKIISNSYNTHLLQLLGSNVRICNVGCTAGSTNILDGKWHHFIVVGDTTSIRGYLDGKTATPEITISSSSTVIINPISIGNDCPSGSGTGVCSGSPSYPFNGSIDEVAIWNRALSSAEVLELYRRGANRVKYQVRSCSSADCSDQDALTSSYKGWKGPDNTGLTYFSELYNTTNNVLGGTVATSSPLMTFANFGSLAVSNNRYFQYRAILESDDQNSLCTYNSTAASCSPELQSVAIGPNHYDNTIQSIISKSSIGSSFVSFDTNGFTETIGANNCSSGVKYSISKDGTNWYYWSSGSWISSSDYSTASDAATIKSHIDSFAGPGTIQMKTYLKSNGTSPCEVDNLQFTGKKY